MAWEIKYLTPNITFIKLLNSNAVEIKLAVCPYYTNVRNHYFKDYLGILCFVLYYNSHQKAVCKKIRYFSFLDLIAGSA